MAGDQFRIVKNDVNIWSRFVHNFIIEAKMYVSDSTFDFFEFQWSWRLLGQIFWLDAYKCIVCQKRDYSNLDDV